MAGGTLAYGLALVALGRLGAAATVPLLVVLGLLAAVIFPPTLALTADWTAPGTRASALAGFNFAGSLGFALGPLAGAWAERVGGFSLAFDVAGAAAVAAALAVAAAAVLTRSGATAGRR
jgi:MFS family permease